METLKAKLRQNAFYGGGVKNLLSELLQLEAFTVEIDREALSKGLFEVRHMVNSRLPEWMTRLNDVQATISKRLFVAKKINDELMYLSKAVLWMSRNPTKVGFDVTVTKKAKDALLRPVAIKIRPQVDVSDVQIYNQQILVRAVSRLPVAPDPWQKPEEPAKAYVKRTEVLEVEEVAER